MGTHSLNQKILRWRQVLSRVPEFEAHEELDKTLDEMAATLEDFHHAEDNLREQNEALDAAREATEKERRRYAELFEFAPDAYLVTDLHGTIQDANFASGRLLGLPARHLRGKPFLVFLHEADRHGFGQKLLSLRDEEGPVELELRVQPRTGDTRHCGVVVVPVREPLGRTEAFRWTLRDITDRKQAEELVRRLNAELESRVADRTAALAAANERSAFLAEAGGALEGSLDYAATTGSVVRLAVPTLGRACFVDMLEGDSLIRVAGEDIEEQPAPDPGMALDVVRSGRPGVRAQEDYSALCVPLRARGQILGALTLVSTERQYSTDDVPTVEEFGRRAAMAIDNARLFDQTAKVAEMLQRSLLPDGLPQIVGVSVSARYFPAKQERIGGDWYDVLERPDGVIGIAVGDVSGKGVRAAVMMGKLRSALRAYAMEGHSPAEVLDRLDRLLRDFDPSQMATVLYMTVDPATWTVHFSSAGHVPPLLRTPGKTATYLGDGRYVPLGVSDRSLFREAVHVVEPGSTLLLYTDGLIERQGGPLEDGLIQLQAAVAEGPENPDALCDHVVASLVPSGSVADDVALIALRVVPALARPLEITVSAEPSELRNVRSTLIRWMYELNASSDEAYDVVVAACEAVTNAIQHAYGPGPASILVRAALENSGVVVTVRDWGRWFDRSSVGYGLRLIRGLMDSVEIDTQGEGTAISMRRHLERGQSP